MLQIDHVYEFFYENLFKDFQTIFLPNGFLPTNITGDILDDMHVFNEDKINKIFFYDQEPVLPNFIDPYLDFGKFRTNIDILATSEKSLLIDTICKNNNAQSLYYFFHGFAALDWYRGYNHSFLSQPWPSRKFDHAFICPNNIVGGQRSHRLRLLSELGQRGCIDQNLISFPATCPYEHETVEDLFLKHSLTFPKNLSLPLIIDNDCNHANNSHRIDFWAQAMRCFCHVVTETVYDDNRIHITEKTFKPIVLQQPFLIVGNRGALKYLRDYGFQTFSDLWDESYDDLDHGHRIGAVADICEEITSWSPQKMRQAQLEIADVVKHNHDWFYGGFQDVLWKETCEMIDRWQ